MKIRFLRGEFLRIKVAPLFQEITEQILDSGVGVSLGCRYVTAEFRLWEDFLKCVYKAYCRCSLDERGRLMRLKISVYVSNQRSEEQHIRIWLDEAVMALRYELV